MAKLKTWASANEAKQMLTYVHEEGGEEIGYALLHSRRKRDNCVTTLANAKLNPVEPTPTSPHTRCGWPTTARDHRLVLAPNVADPISLGRLFGDYDASTPDHQQLLAAVLTVQFDRDRPLHDQFDELVCFATTYLAWELRLTSLAVLHAPADRLAAGQPHGHLLVLARTHTAAGWGPVHPYMREEAHPRWADDWTRSLAGYRKLQA